MTIDSAQAVSRRRRIAFYLAVAAGIVLAVIGLGELMALAALGWLDAATLDGMYAGAAMHRMHVLAQAVIAWLVAIGIVIQPWRSPRTFAAALVAIVALAASTTAAAVGGVFDPMAVIGIVALGVIVWAHPARDAARVRPIRRRMLLLGAPLIAGGLVLAAQQLGAQLSAASSDPHAAVGHYGFTAAMAIGVASAALIGSTSLPGRTVAAWMAMGGSLYYGMASIVFPTEASSLGAGGGVVAVVAAVAFAVGIVTSAQAAAESTRPEPQPQAIG
jgi:hypothetical protein